MAVAMTPLWPSMAQAMTVAQFLARADAVKARGALAILSPDAGLLKAEMNQAVIAYRGDVAAARKAGRRPPSCPPAPGRSDITSDDVIAWLRAVPAAMQAQTSVKAAFYALMKAHYPCK
jgi:intracellular sulfur oxidation DsrE/DsrF family protein